MLPHISGEFGVVADPEIRFASSGKAWMSLRVVAKDSVRDANGTYTDGEPMFLNAVVFSKQAEHLTDSICKGDAVVLTGVLAPVRPWTDSNGVERKNDIQIKVSEIGVSVKFGTAKTNRALESSGQSAPQAPNGVESDPGEMPF